VQSSSNYLVPPWWKNHGEPQVECPPIKQDFSEAHHT
jgi:hypothetical protein